MSNSHTWRCTVLLRLTITASVSAAHLGVERSTASFSHGTPSAGPKHRVAAYMYLYVDSSSAFLLYSHLKYGILSACKYLWLSASMYFQM